MAYEGFFYWQDWENYLGVVDDQGMARYMNCGTVLLKSATGHDEKVLTHYRDLGVEHEVWDVKTLKEKVPVYDTHAFWPPKRPDDPKFWAESERELDGAIYTPGSGYMNDPQLASHNLQRAAEAQGGEFLFRKEVGEIRRANGRVTGVTLTDGTEIDAPVVVNVAGPHSFVINRMAGVEDEMNVKTRALRHEVHHVPSPPGFDFEQDGFHTSDGDTGIYFRPESGNHILIGSEDPECDPQVWVDEPRQLRPRRDREAVGGAGLPARAPDAVAARSRTSARASSTSTTSPTTGSRSTTAPPSTASTWRSARAATSSRTRRWSAT